MTTVRTNDNNNSLTITHLEKNMNEKLAEIMNTRHDHKYRGGSVSGGYTNNWAPTTGDSRAKVPTTTKTIFGLLMAKGEMRKVDLRNEFLKANNIENIGNAKKSHCDSTIAWHVDKGNLSRRREGGKCFLSVTSRGVSYFMNRMLSDMK